MLMGLPVFDQPEHWGSAAGFVAYEQPGAVCVVPTSLWPEPLQVDQYLTERDDRIAWYTVVSAAFTIYEDLRSPARARPVPLGSGLVRLTAPAAAGVPAAALTPQPCDPATGAVLPTLVRLDGVAGDLLVGALRGGLQTLGAVMLVTLRGVAARCSGTLVVDVDALREGIGIGPVPPDVLLDRAAAGLPGVTVTGGPTDERVMATAVVDRVVARLATPAFFDANPAGSELAGGLAAGGDPDQGGWLFAPDGRGPTKLTWDLSEPVMAIRLLRLSCDPVLGGSGTDAVIRQHEVASLTDGRERLLVYTTLPMLPGGVVTALATLTAPPTPPARPFETEVTAQLQPLTPTEALLHLSPGEPLVYDLQGSVVLDTDRGPRECRGAARSVTGDSTPVVAAADLGLRLIPVHATGGLLRFADVTVNASTTRWVGDPAVFVSSAKLSPSADADAWLAVPRDATEVTVQAVATTRGAHPRTVIQALPDAAVWLDPFSFTDPAWDSGQESEEEAVIVVDAGGLRVAGLHGGHVWQFLPLTAGPVRNESGEPQLNVIEAGGLALLMITTALEVSDTAQATARGAALKAGAPDDVRLSPAAFDVQGSAELLIMRNGQQRPLAASVPSGTVSQDAIFSVTLTEADLSVVHRALAGEAGLLAVRYLLRPLGSGALVVALSANSIPVPVVTDASTWRQ